MVLYSFGSLLGHILLEEDEFSDSSYKSVLAVATSDARFPTVGPLSEDNVRFLVFIESLGV